MSHIYKHHTHTSHALGGAVPLSINLNRCKGRVPEQQRGEGLGHFFKRLDHNVKKFEKEGDSSLNIKVKHKH